jgi:phosphoribosylformylglycinamidine synthase
VKIKDLLINKVESQEKDLSIFRYSCGRNPSKVIVHEILSILMMLNLRIL